MFGANLVKFGPVAWTLELAMDIETHFLKTIILGLEDPKIDISDDKSEFYFLYDYCNLFIHTIV